MIFSGLFYFQFILLMIKKEITIYDIARELNISTATVSRALKDHPAISDKTKKRIAETARKLGYQMNTFASSLRNKRTNSLGLIVPRLNSMFMSDVIAGIEKVVNESGYNLIISQSLESYEKEKANADTMFKNRVDGLMVSLASTTSSLDHFRPFTKKGIPLLFFDRIAELENCPVIVIDNFKAAYELTSHLISMGSKNLVHITSGLTRNVYNDRFNGFLKALSDNHLLFNPFNLFITDLSQEAGIDIARRILEMPEKPDGVFVANDSCAVSCMLYLRKNQVCIPGDMLFAGFNNDFISTVVEPNLTTIDYKGFEMGRITAQTLVNQLSNNQSLQLTQSIVIRHELLIRDSSQPKH
jgi:LacI family transcriptional regulator